LIRCAFCHDDLGADERHECAACRTILHWDCRALLGHCPTLGCKDSTFAHGGRIAVARPAFRSALARLRTAPPVSDFDLQDPDVELKAGICPSCGGKPWLARVCAKCGARVHSGCWWRARGCPRGCDREAAQVEPDLAEATAGDTEKPSTAEPAKRPEAPPRDPARFKKALENLKKRPPQND
jgi:hypothetical protein